MKQFFSPIRMLKESKETQRGHHWIVETLIFIAVFFVSQMAVSIPVSISTVIALFTSDDMMDLLTQALETGDMSVYMEAVTAFSSNLPDWVMIVQLCSTALATLVAILFCRYIEKRPISSMGLRRRHILREYAIGTAIGILLISVCVGLCLLTGSLKLQVSSFSPLLWFLFLIGFMIQGMSEEVICRGYMMVSVSRKNALWLAVITNSVVFALLHLGNPGVGPLPLLNIALFGVLESVYVLKRGDLWGACAIHSFWNFFQGNIFGISVSGTGAGASPLSASLTEGHTLLNGGSFGIEGGLIVTAVLTAAILLAVFLLPVNQDETVKERIE